MVYSVNKTFNLKTLFFCKTWDGKSCAFWHLFLLKAHNNNLLQFTFTAKNKRLASALLHFRIIKLLVVSQCCFVLVCMYVCVCVCVCVRVCFGFSSWEGEFGRGGAAAIIVDSCRRRLRSRGFYEFPHHLFVNTLASINHVFGWVIVIKC